MSSLRATAGEVPVQVEYGNQHFDILVANNAREVSRANTQIDFTYCPSYMEVYMHRAHQPDPKCTS